VWVNKLAQRLQIDLQETLKLEYDMPISFDSALGIHDQALALRSRRAEMLASNIANADTPGYKAKDIDFKAALSQAQDQLANSQAGRLYTTQSNHIAVNTAMPSEQTLYRIPNQPSLDGNTVDPQLEKAAFAENALRYQASLQFLDGKFKSMMAALKGE
jgi:flagellar basal-body rod protein FlgB